MNKGIWILIITLTCIMSFTFVSCGNKPMTYEDALEVEEDYQEGKITYEEYLEAANAYYNQEPLPKRGFGKLISNFFGAIWELMVGIFGIIILAIIYKVVKG